MKTANAVTALRERLTDLERRLDEIANDVKALQRHTTALDELRKEIWDLKLEVEERREE